MLETTSQAILPSQVNKKVEQRHKITSIKSFDFDGKALTGTFSKGTFCLYFINEKTMRFILNPFGEVNRVTSIAAVGDVECIPGSLVETDEVIRLQFGFNDVIITTMTNSS